MICRVLVVVMVVCLPLSVLAEEKVPVTPATAVAATAEPDTVVIDQFKKKKAAVMLTHKEHAHKYKVADKLMGCKECHHKDEKGKEKKCSVVDCHDGKKELAYTLDHGDKDKPKIKKGEKIDDYSQKGFYHANCLEDCHKSDKEKKAPTKCEGCHPKAAGEKEE